MFILHCMCESECFESKLNGSDKAAALKPYINPISVSKLKQIQFSFCIKIAIIVFHF